MRRIFSSSRPKKWLTFFGAVGVIFILLYIGMQDGENAASTADLREGANAGHPFDDGYLGPLVPPIYPRGNQREQVIPIVQPPPQVAMVSGASFITDVAQVPTPQQLDAEENAVDALPLVISDTDNAVVNCYVIAPSISKKGHCLGMPPSEHRIIGEELSREYLDNELRSRNQYPWDPVQYAGQYVNPEVNVQDVPFAEVRVSSSTRNWHDFVDVLASGDLLSSDAIFIHEWVNTLWQAVPQSLEQEGKQSRVTVGVDASRSPFSAGDKHLVRLHLRHNPSLDTNRKRDVVFIFDKESLSSSKWARQVAQHISLLVHSEVSDDSVSVVEAGRNGQRVFTFNNPRSQEEMVDVVTKSATLGTQRQNGEQISNLKELLNNSRSDVLFVFTGNMVSETVVNQIESLYKSASTTEFPLTVVIQGSEDRLVVPLKLSGSRIFNILISNEAQIEEFALRKMSSLLGDPISNVRALVEFNPSLVKSYRLIGYDALKRDSESAGMTEDDQIHDVFAGDSNLVYEIAFIETPFSDTDILAIVNLEWDEKEGKDITSVNVPASVVASSQAASSEMVKLAAYVEFAELLKKSYWACNPSHRNGIEELREYIVSMGVSMELLSHAKVVQERVDWHICNRP